MTLTATAASTTRQTLPGVDGVDALVEHACRTLNLPTIRDQFTEIAESSLRQQSSHKTFLLELLEAEVGPRGAPRRCAGKELAVQRVAENLH